MMSRFKVPQASKPPVDPAALEKFANGADADPVLPKDAVAPVEATPSASVAPEAVTARSAPVKAVRAGPPSVAPIRAAGELANRNLSLRLTDAQMELIDTVYASCTYKLKQKLVESILFPALVEMQKKLSCG